MTNAMCEPMSTLVMNTVEPMELNERVEGQLVRGEDASQAGSALMAGLADVTWPDAAGRVYAGCEATALRGLRTAVLEASGLDKSRIVARGYWRVGAVNHPDHDYVND